VINPGGQHRPIGEQKQQRASLGVGAEGWFAASRPPSMLFEEDFGCDSGLRPAKTHWAKALPGDQVVHPAGHRR